MLIIRNRLVVLVLRLKQLVKLKIKRQLNNNYYKGNNYKSSLT